MLGKILKNSVVLDSLDSTYSDLKCHTMHVVESNQLLYCLVGKKGPSTTPFPLTIAKLQSPIYIWRHLKGIQPILKLHDLRDWNRRRRISNCKLLFTSTTSWPVVYQAALPLCTKSKNLFSYVENSIPLHGPSKKVSHYIQYIVYITYQLLCKAFVSKFLFAFSKIYSHVGVGHF